MSLWLLSGFVSTAVCIWLFRRDGSTDKKWELYLAGLAPLFGPVPLALAMLDKVKRDELLFQLKAIWGRVTKK